MGVWGGQPEECTPSLCEVLQLEVERASTSGGGKIWLEDQEKQHERGKDTAGPAPSRQKEKGRREKGPESTESLHRGMMRCALCFVTITPAAG